MARNRGLVWAMEELAEQEAIVEPQEELAADSLESDMLENNEQAAEIENMNASIEEAVEDAETLEDIASVMEESTENGGMDTTAARVAEVAVESIYNRLGVRKKNAMPAMESFGGKGTRMGATKHAMESVSETIKVVWEKIAGAIAKVWDWIKGFFTNVCKAAGKLKDRAKALKDKVVGLKGQKAEEKVTLALDWPAGTKPIQMGCDAMIAAANNAEANVATLSKDMSSSDITDVAVKEGAAESYTTVDMEFASMSKQIQDHMVVWSTEAFPDGTVVELEVAEGGQKGEEGLKCKGKQRSRKERRAAKRAGLATEAAAETQEVEAAKPEELQQVCEKVEEAAKIVESKESMLSKINSAASTFLGHIKSIGSKILESVKGLGTTIQKACTAVSQSVSSFISNLFQSIVSAGKATLDWVEKHYAAYKAKKVAAKADKDQKEWLKSDEGKAA